MQDCFAGDSGGAVYALSEIHFLRSGTCGTTFSSNIAIQNGGAIASFRPFVVKHGHHVVFVNNSAGLDGGAMSLDEWGSLQVEDEGCETDACESLRGNGRCDPECMSRGCNW
jgi:hypothetical protein